MKKPSFPFYPGDYLRDAAVRALSLEARGLWVDMLCLMHQAPRRGYLELAEGVPIGESQIARMVGESVNRVVNLIEEMRLTGVFSEENGVIFSRRMVRDEKRFAANTENGKKGGNPQLKAISVNRIPTDTVNQTDNGQVNGVVGSFSSSSSSSKKNTLLSKQQAEWFDTWWLTVWRKDGKEASRKSFFKAVKNSSDYEAVCKGVVDQLPKMLAREEQYRPTMAKWLNNKCWLDEVAPVYSEPTETSTRFVPKPRPVDEEPVTTDEMMRLFYEGTQ